MHPDDLTDAETKAIQRMIDASTEVACELPTDSAVRAWFLRYGLGLQKMMDRRTGHLALVGDQADGEDDDEDDSTGRPALRAV